MISRISVLNFKSLRDVQVDIAPLTILMGLNGAGKSSFIQLLLLLKQNAIAGENPVRVELNKGLLRLGTQGDVQYCYNTGIEKSVVSVESDTLKTTYAVEMAFDEPMNDEITLSPCSPDDDSRLDARRQLIAYLNNIQYISAERGAPRQEHDYSPGKIAARQWGEYGENAVAFLAELGDSIAVHEKMRNGACVDPMLRAQVNAWLGVVAHGATVNMKVNEPLRKVELSFSFAAGVGKVAFRPQNVGFGLSYVLSLLVMILTAHPGDCLIIENPEAHIHPRGQAELGRLLALAASAGIQIFAETHSDHVLNGVRVAVKNGVLDRHATCVQFFRRIDQAPSDGIYEQYSTARKIEIDSHGELSEYFDDFMDEWDRQLQQLI